MDSTYRIKDKQIIENNIKARVNNTQHQVWITQQYTNIDYENTKEMLRRQLNDQLACYETPWYM